ncbi:hypothetical protein HD554DRAFT_257636 [Boletus coccyginus]|nr:hypothetical protein HD554DRAFT_257636 [Boletus coccyginus]
MVGPLTSLCDSEADDASDVLSLAIDFEVIKLCSKVPSQTTGTSGWGCFRRELATRDGERCVWSGLANGEGTYIIPWSKGDEWLQLIIANWPHVDEPRLDDLRSINEIRNRIMGAPFPHHRYFDSRTATILKTPNCILQTNDVPVQPSCCTRLPLGTSHPRGSRYTFQWFAANDETLHATFPNNSDAAFLSHYKPNPSDLLLHYNYGAAAVKNWGRNHAILGSRPGLPRPHPPVPVATGPTKSVGDRTTAIAKLTAARDMGIQQQA